MEDYELLVLLQKRRVEQMKNELEQMKNELEQIEKELDKWEHLDEAMYYYYKGQRLQLKAQIGYLEEE